MSEGRTALTEGFRASLHHKLSCFGIFSEEVLEQETGSRLNSHYSQSSNISVHKKISFLSTWFHLFKIIFIILINF